ncbi:MAG: hypothetical protein J6X33_00750 [Clostridiales bacterium]|nr:hypothetical protein [Clostridiales bacterium]
MRRYIYNARDIAAYIKYFSVPTHLEVSYMQYIFNLGDRVLAKPLASDFEKFKMEVYRELYSLWANGFENDKSDIADIALPGQIPFVCDPECMNLEIYMKLISLHLIYTRNLPYVNLNFTGLAFTLHIRCSEEVFDDNIIRVLESLSLTASDKFGKPFSLESGIPDELLRVSLTDDFKEILALNNVDFKESLRKEQNAWLEDLKKKSLEVFGRIPQGKRKKSSSTQSSRKKSAKGAASASSRQDSKLQPKGAPVTVVKPTTHNDGGSAK